MKKTILLSLAAMLALSVTGCGASEESQSATAPTGPIDPVIAESLAPTECPETGPADDLAISIGNEAVCDLGSVQFSLSLPETWDYEIRSVTVYETVTDAIIFWNIAYPEDTFTLAYAPMLGICGTGVTSEEITLPYGNLSGWKYTETLETDEKYWLFLTLSDPDVPIQGNMLQLDATVPLADWEALESDFDTILNTIRLQYPQSKLPLLEEKQPD